MQYTYCYLASNNTLQVTPRNSRVFIRYNSTKLVPKYQMLRYATISELSQRPLQMNRSSSNMQ